MASLRRQELENLWLVACGAVPGALLRWQLQDVRSANVLSCLLLGLLLPQARRRPRLILLAGIGFCGSLSTFSTWILELSLAVQAAAMTAVAERLLGDLLTGLAALALGLGLAKAPALLRR
jgi:CrcB protein